MKPSPDSNSGPRSGSSCTSTELKDLLKQRKCVKIIGQNKYETTGADTQIWWKKQFESLEKKSAMPFYKRKNHLEKCFSKDTMKKLIAAKIEINPDWGVDEKKIDEEEGVVKPTVQRKVTEGNIRLSKYETINDSEPEKEYTNPYLNFFKKSAKRAQIWRPQPKPTIEALPLIMKAQQLEEKVATEFDEWFKQVGSQHASEIDKDVILSIFEILMSYPVATSMSREVFEIGAVPEVTANYLGFPQRSESNSVQREIKKDIRAGNRKPMLVAFNQSLPIELRRKPFTEKLKEKWFEYQMRHQDLESMAAVWRGITDLHTTRVFINWLLDDPDLPTPPYFKTQGIMHYKNLTTLLDMGIEEEDLELAKERKQSIHHY